MKRKEQDTVFNPGQADWVQEKGAQGLTKDQQALLLALAQLESEMGRELSEEERAAIESLAGNLEGFDPQGIKSAVHKMVNNPADPDRKTTWSELKERLH
jgi:hypothetical protein